MEKTNINRLGQKVALIIGMTLLMMIPQCVIESQIKDRSGYENEATTEIAKNWGPAITLTSPKLRFQKHPSQNPTKANTEIKMDVQVKEKGKFKLPVYTATYKTIFRFEKPKEERKDKPDEIYLFLQNGGKITSAYLKNITTGAQSEMRIYNDSVEIGLGPETQSKIYTSEFEVVVTAKVTQTFTYSPRAEEEMISMKGNVLPPNFSKGASPDSLENNEKSFSANWRFKETERNDENYVAYTPHWENEDYKKVTRSVKYGILFVSLTFLLILLIEIVGKFKVHIMQYGLIGLSISIFYLLLLAISEATAFNIAYLIAAVSVTSLIYIYLKGFVSQSKFIRIIIGEQIFLNGYFFMLISLEDNAFLVGTIGLFVALASFMIFTRKLDWYTGKFLNKPSVHE